MKRFVLLLVLLAHPAFATGTLRYGLEFDPDVLDPARSGSYTDRIVSSWMCDQLLDVDRDLNFVPQLATAWEWAADGRALTLHLRPNVTFQDGAAFDASGVQANIARYQNAPESLRKTELRPVTGVEILDPLTVRITLSAPYAPLLSLLANRPGIMLSPSTLSAGSDAIIAHPVCTGPYSFVERVAQSRIVLKKYPGHWNAAAMGPDRVEFSTIVDNTVRRVNLAAGALDIANRIAPTDSEQVAGNPRLRLVTSPSIGFQLISFNLDHGPAAQTPIGRDPRVREAFEKSIDRAALNQVVLDGRFVPSNQTEAPGSRYWSPDDPVPPRDVAGARALLKQAGIERVAFTMLVGNDPVNIQIGEVIQSMAAEAGFDIKVQAIESLTGLAAERAGDYQAAMVIWSGRPDPDGNSSIWMSCAGFLNWGRYCNPKLDQLFAEGGATIDPLKRVPIYRAITAIAQRDRSHMVLFHFTWLWGVSRAVDGLVPMPDGILRPAGVRLR